MSVGFILSDSFVQTSLFCIIVWKISSIRWAEEEKDAKDGVWQVFVLSVLTENESENLSQVLSC